MNFDLKIDLSQPHWGPNLKQKILGAVAIIFFSMFTQTPAKAMHYPMSRPEATGAALENSLLQTQVVYIFTKPELEEILHDLREQFSTVARRETAFSPLAYDEALRSGGHRLAEHCGCVVYAVQRLYGGEAILGHFVAENGSEIWHMWNRIPVRTTAGVITIDVDLTKGQFGLTEANLNPPGLSFKIGSRVYDRQSVDNYRWDNAVVNPLRAEILQFWTAFLTRGHLKHPKTKLAYSACELLF